MRGIIDNINNPFIVTGILFDYFKVKNNLYLYKKDLLILVFSLYRGLRLNDGKKIQYFIVGSLLKLRLTNFKFALDSAFNYTTYDSIRSILSRAVKLEDYQLPTPEIARSEIERIFGNGMAGIVSKHIVSANTLVSKLFEKKDHFKLTENKEFANIPMFNAIKNYLKDITALADQLIDKPLIESARALVLLNVDSIFSKERNKVLPLLTVGKILQLGLKDLNSTTVIYYGSASTESTYTSARDLSKSIKNSSN
jgi:hypothetical protein